MFFWTSSGFWGGAAGARGGAPQPATGACAHPCPPARVPACCPVWCARSRLSCAAAGWLTIMYEVYHAAELNKAKVLSKGLFTQLYFTHLC